MRTTLLTLGALVLSTFGLAALPGAAAVDHSTCLGLERGEPNSDDYECAGVFIGGGGSTFCVGVYHNHPNPDHPDGCTPDITAADFAQSGAHVRVPSTATILA